MSYWLYIQAVINLALVGACVYLYVGYRRVRSQGAWRQELAPLVDTLGELLVEIGRVTARNRRESQRGASASPSKTAAPIAPAPEAPARGTVWPVPAANKTEEDNRANPPPAPSSAVEAVLALSAQGMSAEEISQRLGRPIGEVSLVLGLRSSGVAVTA